MSPDLEQDFVLNEDEEKVSKGTFYWNELGIFLADLYEILKLAHNQIEDLLPLIFLK